MPSEKKVEAVAALKEKLEGAQAVVLADFTGLDVEKLNELRREFRKSDSRFYVFKNTLGRLAVREVGMEGLEQFLEGPTGWAVAVGDPVAPAKVIKEFAKTHELPKVKGGYIDGAVLMPEEVKRVADLPPKPILVAQVLGLVQGPVTGVAGTLKSVISSLAVAVEEIRKQKEAGGEA